MPTEPSPRRASFGPVLHRARAAAQGSRGVWRTTTFRLTLGFGAVFAAGVVLLLGLVYLQTAGYLTRRVDRQLNAEARVLQSAGASAILRQIGVETRRDPLDSFGLYSADGQQVGGATQLQPADLPQDGRPRDVDGRNGRRRAMAVPLPWGETLVVARDIGQIARLRRIILAALVWSGAAIVGLGLLTGVALSLHPLRRVQAVREAGDAIAGGDLAVRLPVGGRRDELDELAAIVNAMMDEVERLVVQARTVGEGVAHELRTPLTRLRATLDHARAALPPGDPAAPMLEACTAETEGVLARFRALLRIAALEARPRRGEMGQADLTALAEQAFELYAPLAAEQHIALSLEAEPGVIVRAESDLLFEALANLLDNALKFSNPGGRVTLRLGRTAAGPVLEVQDEGPGIPEAERALVIQRFYRGAHARSAPGYGLGLSLVAAVVALHGFRLEFGAAAPGTVARIFCGTR